MKIEIDLNEILGDENGSETLNDSIRRQVIERIRDDVSSQCKQEIDTAISKAISEQVRLALSETIPALIEQALDTEFTPVGKWGEKSEATTARKQLAKELETICTYKKCTWDKDKNVFTKAVDNAVSAKLDSFHKLFDKSVDAKFIEESMAYATQKLQKRLGVAG